MDMNLSNPLFSKLLHTCINMDDCHNNKQYLSIFPFAWILKKGHNIIKYYIVGLFLQDISGI